MRVAAAMELFLGALAASDLSPEELRARDRLYEVIVCIRGVKRAFD